MGREKGIGGQGARGDWHCHVQGQYYYCFLISVCLKIFLLCIFFLPCHKFLNNNIVNFFCYPFALAPPSTQITFVNFMACPSMIYLRKQKFMLSTSYTLPFFYKSSQLDTLHLAFNSIFWHWLSMAAACIHWDRGRDFLFFLKAS